MLKSAVVEAPFCTVEVPLPRMLNREDQTQTEVGQLQCACMDAKLTRRRPRKLASLIRGSVSCTTTDRVEEHMDNALCSSDCMRAMHFLRSQGISDEGYQIERMCRQAQQICGCTGHGDLCYWSSTGSADPDSVDSLTFSLASEVNVVSAVGLWPYRWVSARVHVGIRGQPGSYCAALAPQPARVFSSPFSHEKTTDPRLQTALSARRRRPSHACCVLLRTRVTPGPGPTRKRPPSRHSRCSSSSAGWSTTAPTTSTGPASPPRQACTVSFARQCLTWRMWTSSRCSTYPGPRSLRAAT
jgi:hypothetical protein